MHLNISSIAAMASRKRAALINSLSGFKSANLVGTADADGHCNLAIMSSVVHLGSHPPLLALIVRPGAEERHTLHNLLASGHYSINHVTSEIVEAAHQTAARYSRDTSEFEATGLTPEWWPGFGAPLVAEARVKLALELRDHQELKINNTHLVIGEIIHAEMPEACLREDGSLDLVAANSMAISGLDSYHQTKLFRRMAYAKPDQSPQVVKSIDTET
ncbi:MAG: flavin reductase family protein [Halioglobus sp.]